MRRVHPLPALFSLLLALACTQSEDDACGDELVYDDGACRPKPAGGGSGGSDTGTGGGDEGGMGAAAPTSFGASCEESADCTDDTDYCAISPVSPPYCTASGCDADESLCPEGWMCFDVSAFSPGEPWICAKP